MSNDTRRMEPPERETALHQMLQNLLTDERYSDIDLKGSDGSLVPANRAILAARSTVFDRMLYGDFAESNQTEIRMNFDGPVLKLLVEYIYTDTNAILLHKVSELVASARNSGFIPSATSLMQAAMYFELPKLFEKVELVAIRALKEDPSLSLPFYAACEVVLEGTQMEERAFEKIRMDPSILLSENNEVYLLSASRLEQILSHREVQADELTLFQILQKWSSGGLARRMDQQQQVAEEQETYRIDREDSTAAATASENVEMDVEGTGGVSANTEDRLQKAKELVSHIALELISPPELLASVANSGLITAPDLAVAIQKQATMNPSCYNKPRWTHVTWKHSGSVVLLNDSPHQTLFVVLSCPPMVSGIHKWSIRVEHVMQSPVSGVSLGLASARTYSGLREAWTYPFEKSSTVNFTLDLTDSGTLSVSVDGGPNTFNSENLKDKWIWGTDVPGFLPAAKLYLGSQVRLLDFCSETQRTS